MTPAASPLPTARNFPFHPSTGNHTSSLMAESLVGVIVTRTRQNARGVLNGVAPAGTTAVRVMLAAGIASPTRLSHDPAAMTRTGAARSAQGSTAAIASNTP